MLQKCLHLLILSYLQILMETTRQNARTVVFILDIIKFHYTVSPRVALPSLFPIQEEAFEECQTASSSSTPSKEQSSILPHFNSPNHPCQRAATDAHFPHC